jgi:hypothetical protein
MDFSKVQNQLNASLCCTTTSWVLGLTLPPISPKHVVIDLPLEEEINKIKLVTRVNYHIWVALDLQHLAFHLTIPSTQVANL